jgi:hypothetical protein
MAKGIKYIKVALSHSTHSFIAMRYSQKVVQLILLFLTSLSSWSWRPTYFRCKQPYLIRLAHTFNTIESFFLIN